MIAHLIQRLTLIAFTAHAVLGCCWHHSHAIGSECCSKQIAADVEDAGHREGCCCHSHDESPVTDWIGDAGSPGEALAESVCCSDSHEHSHRCNEAHCSFVPCSTKQLDFGDDHLSITSTFASGIELAPLIRQLPNRDVRRSFDQRALSSPNRCVALQSWQI